MDDLPQWSKRLKSIYVCLRLGKRNKALRRRYYRQIELEKYRLAVLGVNQEKIRQVCRYLSNQNCVRKCFCEHCQRILDFVGQQDLQLIFDFT